MTSTTQVVRILRDVQAKGVSVVELCKPPNPMGSLFWKQYREAFEELSHDTDTRAIVVLGTGKHFTVGLDLKDAAQMMSISGGESDGDDDDGDGEKKKGPDVARKAFHLRRHILELQESFTAMERCPQPVIVGVHGACVGGGIDLMCAADIRFASKNSFFTIKEVDIALAADVGTLARLEKVTGNVSWVRELAYTARNFSPEEAMKFGFISRILGDEAELRKATLNLASEIASKSPVAIAGTKANLLFARDHTVDQALDYVATWNSAMLQTSDLPKAAMAAMAKQKDTDFSKL